LFVPEIDQQVEAGAGAGVGETEHRALGPAGP